MKRFPIMNLISAAFSTLVGGGILGTALMEVMRWSINSPLFNESIMIGDFIMSSMLFVLAVVNYGIVISSYKKMTKEVERLENYIKD